MNNENETDSNQSTSTIGVGDIVVSEKEGVEPIKTEEKPIFRDKNGLFKEGTAPGPGRPKGKTLKEWMKDKLQKMTDEERVEFLKGVPLDLQWRMAEGNPTSDDKVQQTVKIIIANEDDTDTCTNSDTEGQP